jgi:hypothetical protein
VENVHGAFMVRSRSRFKNERITVIFTVILSFLKREREPDFANVSDQRP